MLTFDHFPDLNAAADFAKTVSERYGVKAIVCDNVEELFGLPPVTAPIVFVERKAEHDLDVVALAVKHGADFAGM